MPCPRGGPEDGPLSLCLLGRMEGNGHINPDCDLISRLRNKKEHRLGMCSGEKDTRGPNTGSSLATNCLCDLR